MMDAKALHELELSIVGAMIQYPETVGSAVAKLHASDFGGLVASDIFEAVQRLHFSGVPVDRITVLRETSLDPGTLDYVLSFAVTSANVDVYADTLLEERRLSELRDLGIELSGAVDLADAAKILDKINQASAGRRNNQPVDALEMIADFVRRKDEPAVSPEYITLGMRELDDTILIERGDVIVLGGYASSGKTLLSIQWALHMAQKYNVGYFSLETNRKKFGERMIAHLLQTSLRGIKRRENTDDEYMAAVKIGMEMSANKGRLKFHEAAGLSVQDIQALSLANRYDVIVVDYLQIVEAGSGELYDRITNISKGLHTMAQRHKITVLELAQLKRPEKTKGQPVPPTMWDFKESGQIENDADVAMLLYPNDINDYRSARHLKVSKNKDGEKLDLDLAFNGARQTMTPFHKPLAETLRKQAAEARREAAEQIQFEDLSDDDTDVPFK